MILGVSIIIDSIFFRLYFGIYTNDEFGDKHLFMKHRPTLKWKFYSPIGMSDMRIQELPKDKKFDEKNFEEFVRQKVKL